MRLRHTEKLKVVIDTNTIISAPFSVDGNPAEVFELLLIEEIKNFTTDDIVTEIIDVLGRDKIKSKISQDKIGFIIDNFKKCSEIVKPSIKLDIIKEDPR